MWVVCMRVSVCLCVTRPACARGDRCVTTWPHPRATRHLLSLTPVPFIGAKTSFLPVLHTHTHTGCGLSMRKAGCWAVTEWGESDQTGWCPVWPGHWSSCPTETRTPSMHRAQAPFLPYNMLSCLPTWWHYCNLFLKLLQPLWTIEKGKGMIPMLSSYKL